MGTMGEQPDFDVRYKKLEQIVTLMYNRLHAELENEQWAGLHFSEVTSWLCAVSFSQQADTPLRQHQIKWLMVLLEELLPPPPDKSHFVA
jgi:hypothetical protein